MNLVKIASLSFLIVISNYCAQHEALKKYDSYLDAEKQCNVLLNHIKQFQETFDKINSIEHIDLHSTSIAIEAFKELYKTDFDKIKSENNAKEHYDNLLLRTKKFFVCLFSIKAFLVGKAGDTDALIDLAVMALIKEDFIISSDLSTQQTLYLVAGYEINRQTKPKVDKVQDSKAKTA